LTNEELERCHYLLHIPCDPGFSSLNVAAAVQVVAYELFLAARQRSHGGDSEPALATAAEMESFYGHLERTLYDLRFLHETKAGPSVMRRLRRIFNRSVLEKKEIHLLRGILTAVQLRTRPQA
jgi:TrmH family RNA methyltransferase